MSKYYQKELPDSPLFIHGHPFRFDILETADPGMIGMLDGCIRRSVGGIKELTKEQYDEEVKKKANEQALNKDLKQRPWRQELQALQHGTSAFAAVEGRLKQHLAKPPPPTPNPRPLPEPIEVPSAELFKEFKRPPPLAKESAVKAITL